MLVKSTVNKEVGMSAGSYDTWNLHKEIQDEKAVCIPQGQKKQDDLTLAFHILFSYGAMRGLLATSS